MEFIRFYQILAFLSVSAVVTSHAAFPPEVYWNSKLPNSAMPKSIRDLLQPYEWLENENTYVGVVKGQVEVKSASGTYVGVRKGGVGVSTGKPGGGRTNVGVGKGGVDVRTHTKKGRPVYVGVHPGFSPFNYIYAATETQLHRNPNLALFFLTKDLIPGKNMNLNFFKTENQATFLPRKVVNSIPFSSAELPEIFRRFSVKPRSEEAEIMKKTIQECEEKKTTKGEEKFCATSLESMVDFSTLKIGRNVEAISTEVENGSAVKNYDIAVVKKVSGDKASVSCHRLEYAYAVFYCHKIEKTEVYRVSLRGADGSTAEAVVVCHLDTAAWNPKHLAFQVLKVMPGSVPVCHFLPQDHIVWVPKY